MFTKLTPQKVRSSEGYVVQFKNRETVQYINQNKTFETTIDLGTTFGIYPHSLHSVDSSINISDQERTKIIDRIVSALNFMGVECEICE
jgi:hypothetical protein